MKSEEERLVVAYPRLSFTHAASYIFVTAISYCEPANCASSVFHNTSQIVMVCKLAPNIGSYKYRLSGWIL